MSESLINQFMKVENFQLLIILIVFLFVYDKQMQLDKMDKKCQISIKCIEQLQRRIEVLEEKNDKKLLNLPMEVIQIKDPANEITKEFWKKLDLFPLFIQFLDEKERNRLCRINKYFAQIGLADNLNQLCLEQRSLFRYPKFLELFKHPVNYTYTHKKRVENKDAILKNNKEKFYFQESEEKVFKNYILSHVYHTIELSDDLREYMDDPDNRVKNNKNKPMRLVISTKEFKIDIEKNDHETFLQLNKSNDSYVVTKYMFEDQYQNNYIDIGEKVAIAFDPKENAVLFFDIEQQTILTIHNNNVSVPGMLTMASRIYISMPPGNYDFYFDEWPEEWKLNYEIFKDYEDL